MSSLIGKKVGFVTYKKFQIDFGHTSYASKECPGLTVSDNEVRKFLEKQNIPCQPVAWDDQESHLLEFDLLIIRSTWNYYYSKDEYRKFIQFIDKTNSLIYNPPSAIKWNSNKSYLKVLNGKGIPIIPTLFLDDIKDLNESDFAFLANENDFVIKPCISGNARNTHKISRKNINSKKIEEFKNNLSEAPIDGIMIQPFIRSITKSGEISLIFFADKFSHAVKRIPISKSFCTHENATKLNRPPLKAIELAEKALAATYQILNFPPTSLLYARVDILYDETRGYLLSELELLEPELFLEFYEPSIEHFSKEILRALYTT